MADVVDRRSRAGGNAATDTSAEAPGTNGLTRRRFMGYLLAAPTVVAAADLAFANSAAAAGLPTVQAVDFYDLTDLLTGSTELTWALIKVTVNPDGTVSFALPRAEVGQGITTAVAMCIADEMDIALDKVHMTLADADPALVFNQFTGGSNSMHSIYTPVRMAAAIAKGQLIKTAAAINGNSPKGYGVKNGVIYSPSGRQASYAELARLAAVANTTRVEAQLKPASKFTLIGTPQTRIDQLDIVTGKKQFAMDLEVPNALPTMLCRAPDINGSPVSLNNKAAILAMPGVTDVALIPHTSFVPGGVAVRAKTFGQCIDAVRAMQVTWSPGPVAGLSASDVATKLQKTQLPMTPALGKAVDTTYTFNFRPGDPLETNCAVANVTSTSAEIWASLKSPIWAKEQLSGIIGLPQSAITVHVVQGGGSFGRHLFSDNAFEAAVVSKAIGKPVKLMWHRTDNFRQGRVHPMSLSRVRATYAGKTVLAYDQRHASVATDFTMGFGDIISATLATEPEGNLGYAQTVFTLTQNVPYNFGLVTQLINEAYNYDTFNTGSVRNIYSPDVATATELTVDQLANAMKVDRYQFRTQFVRDARLKAVMAAVATAGKWGRSNLPTGWGQGIAIHREYKGAIAVMVEIDCTPSTVNRPLPDNITGVTGPRATNVYIAVDVGLPINPKGLEAQMQGGAMDGIAQALTYSLHLQNGHYLEGSWDNAFYTRQWNAPLSIQVMIMPATKTQPGGAGELAVAPTMAAVACAYGAATKSVPTTFPINYNAPLPFTPLPTVPSIPQSPTDGLSEEF
ncbi:MAG TPA: molybdopterin cofactor-binding domain-containing protein [Solirubrobacteraceae bacterium]|nr:molybdopterin cofactor-binding domain-containing protein [Solirubrobacteraceae bacterium]